MRTAFINTLCELAAADARVWLLTADLGFGVLEAFADRFGDRYVNVGVAEQNMAGVAAGLAHSGKIVYIYSIANFPTLRCLEQIRNDLCYHCANVKVVAVGGGFTYGTHGHSHHGVEDLAIMRALPGMTVVAPADPVEAQLATRAVAQYDGPCYLRLGKAGEPIVHHATPAFELGRAITLRDGGDVTIISTGGMLQAALDAATALQAKGISARVLSMHTVKPIDAQAIAQAARDTAAIVTVEEHSVTGGLGAAVAEVLAALPEPRARLARYGVADEVQFNVGSQAHLRSLMGDLPAFVEAALQSRPTSE